MNTYRILVAVALSRPPGQHEFRSYVIAADNYTEAQTIALQMAACTSVMPVWCSRADIPKGIYR